MTLAPAGSRRGFLKALSTAGAAIVACVSSAAGFSRGAPPVTASNRPFRRVVTGLNAAGRSVITSDGAVPVAAQYHFTPAEIAREPVLRLVSGNEVWLFDKVPADLSNVHDPLLGKLPEGNQPAPGGIIARIVRYEPGLAYPMHTTWSVDLDLIVAGSLELRCEEGSTVVGPGDIVVQRGTAHSWRVVGNDPVTMVSILIDAVNGRGARPVA